MNAAVIWRWINGLSWCVMNYHGASCCVMENQGASCCVTKCQGLICSYHIGKTWFYKKVAMMGSCDNRFTRRRVTWWIHFAPMNLAQTGITSLVRSMSGGWFWLRSDISSFLKNRWRVFNGPYWQGLPVECDQISGVSGWGVESVWFLWYNRVTWQAV